MRIIVLDTETTGLSAGQNEIIQLGAVILDGTRADLPEMAVFESLVRPMRPALANPEALKVNGLHLGDLAHAPHPAEVFASFALFAEHEEGAPMVCGHNVAFDLRFLVAAEFEHKAKMPRRGTPICTMNLARKHPQSRGKTVNAKLATIAEFYGIHFRAHDALGDVRATASILRRFVAEAPDLFRGILPAFTAGQKELTGVAPAAPAKAQGYWDLEDFPEDFK